MQCPISEVNSYQNESSLSINSSIQKRFGVIVDGYSTGASLAQAFSKHGIQCIHVQSQPQIPKVYSHTYKPADYVSNYLFEGDVKYLANILNRSQPSFVIPGAECGIELADQLSELLNLPGNGTELSASRRNKYLMLKRVASKGIQIIHSFKAATLEEAVDWASLQEKWPLIVKPLNSAGGEGVKICKTIADIATAYTDIMNTKINMLGFENQAVILQEYIQGEEYVVNTVSHAGNHKLCELWSYTRYSRSGGRQIYDTAKIINFNPHEHEEVVNYAMMVIEALGIKYGPAHVEIIKNDRGCFLIEVGARLMGANLPFSLLADCISTSQAQFTIMSYATPREFNLKQYMPYHVIQPLLAIFMVSNQSGMIRAIHHIDKIKKLNSFFDMKLAVKVGHRLSETIDYQTSPGMIYLSHANSETIERDKKYIRELENKLFELEQS